MPDQKVNIFRNVDQILLYLIDGKMDSAITLLDKTEKLLEKEPHGTEFVVNFRKFINQYRDGAVFLHELASGNLEINPPDDPLHENYVISQYKQLHSNLNHFTWQMQQIARGDLNQKVSFLGEFSVAFNKMLDALREKKLMEDRIKLQNEQLRELNTEKDKFFSIIAHDLRSPFTSFLGLTQLMTEELPRLTMDQIKMFATGMRSSATNLFRLLENLLEWSLMQRGKTGFHAEPFLLKQKITECLILVLDASLKKNIEIFYDIPVEMEVIADVHMLETVIRNLVSNAVKFTPRGGKITIKARPVSGNSFEISIKDTGIGMNKTMVDKLFRLDEHTSRLGTESEPSTGLGLIICKDFIEKHSGKLWVDSTEGVGTTFYFTLPH